VCAGCCALEFVRVCVCHWTESSILVQCILMNVFICIPCAWRTQARTLAPRATRTRKETGGNGPVIMVIALRQLQDCLTTRNALKLWLLQSVLRPWCRLRMARLPWRVL
jgi:hypothetical protein